jgi:hypothetical protein
MKIVGSSVGVAFLCVAGIAGSASDAHAAADPPPDFGRYRIILERQPFGDLLSEAELAAMQEVVALPAPPPFVKDLQLCFIGEGPMGQRVGFFNKQSKQSYYLYLNQTSDDGITVTQIDYADERALLKKEDEEHWITIGGAVPVTGTAETSPSAVARPREAATRSTLRRTSYAERLRQRRAAIHTRTANNPKLEGEDLKKYLQQYQMDLIRKGQPPLPMPLTKEMDDQLVNEGHLPAQE